MWCWAASTTSAISVCSLSPLLAPELVNPAATLSRQALRKQRFEVASANAWNPADTLPIYVGPLRIGDAVDRERGGRGVGLPCAIGYSLSEDGCVSPSEW